LITKLPPWVEIGGYLLAAIAGCVNAVGLLGLRHEAVSHLSGISSSIAHAAVQADNREVLHLAIVMLSFLMGATLSGVIIGNEALKLGKRYGVALCIEGALLAVAAYLLGRGSDAGHYFASGACGLQNALATTYSGAVVRTTHVTGLFTDLGLALGAFLRGGPFQRRKIQLFLLLIAGFISGSAVGAWLFPRFVYKTLYFPASFCLTLAVCYWIYRHYVAGISDGELSD
jgi:uncharacterized membrane protein YoaK (UPF0700 family)